MAIGLNFKEHKVFNECGWLKIQGTPMVKIFDLFGVFYVDASLTFGI